MIKVFKSYNNDIKLVLLTTLFSNIGIFMVIPFLAIYLNEISTIKTTEVGIIIGTAFWFQRAGSLLGGILSDYFDIKRTMIIGLLIRIPGYILLGYTFNFYLLIISCSLIGLGSSLYLPAAKSFLVSQCDKSNKVEVLATRTIFSDVGVAIGPVIGLAVFELLPKLLFISVALIFVIILILNLKIKYKDYISSIASKPNLKDLYSLSKNSLMIKVSIFTFIFMALYMQLEVTIPMYTKQLFGQKVVSIIFILNAVIVITMQMHISKWACKEHNKYVLASAFLLFALSFLLVYFTGKTVMLLFLSVFIFSLAEIIFQIRLDYEATNIKENMVASSFGIMGIVGAFGGLVGSSAGTYFYSKSQSYFWLYLIFISLFSFIVTLVVKKHKKKETEHA